MTEITHTDVTDLIDAWQSYIKTVGDWQALVVNIEPKVGGCGKVYELDNPINRPNESFAIADMRDMDFSEPHVHKNGETEVYFVIEGTGKIGVGNEIKELKPGAIIVTPPNTPHGTYSPNKDIVLAVVNTPPFNANNVVALSENDAAIVRKLLALQG